MCGIVGLFLKDNSLQPSLGRLLSEMLITMTDRGPDSAGIAIYTDKHAGRSKFTIQSENAERDFQGLPDYLDKHLDCILDFRINDTHAVVILDQSAESSFSGVLKAFNPEIRIMSHGSALEIYKEVGLPKQVIKKFTNSLYAKILFLGRHKRPAGPNDRNDIGFLYLASGLVTS